MPNNLKFNNIVIMGTHYNPLVAQSVQDVLNIFTPLKSLNIFIESKSSIPV